ncbi:MAG: hypothetical protein ACE5EU_02255 [Paracoccaceae bacterium]
MSDARKSSPGFAGYTGYMADMALGGGWPGAALDKRAVPVERLAATGGSAMTTAGSGAPARRRPGRG